jgi:hypothetical protein
MYLYQTSEDFRNSGGGEISGNHPDLPWDPPSLLYNGYRVCSPKIKLLGSGVDYPPHLVPGLKKEQS